ncbi:hypothetical protein [Jonesia quinghaiensis]|uniref:hypothetical protein n=1 Tax=Jonesia quinghaiensis TaxID=262806 RepID=UPI00048F2CCE|nr:hypothetical protein [Jonesia quinghaiensis]
MELSVDEWVGFAKGVFAAQFSRIFSNAVYTFEMKNRYILQWNLTVDGKGEFQIVSRLDVLEVYFRKDYCALDFAQYPDEDFEEVISDMLTWIARYYAGEVDVVQSRTRILKKIQYIFKNRESEEVLYFTEVGKRRK